MRQPKLAPLLGLTGRMGSGKSTVAQGLVPRWWEVHKRPVARVRFAGALKSALRAMGLTERHTDGDLKEQPCELLGGATPRWAMQSLGTEWGRALIHPDLWVRLAMHHASEYRRAGIAVVIDDVRYDNEAQAIREAGGVVVKLVRVDDMRDAEAVIAELDADSGALHPSERGVSAGLVDHLVPNYFELDQSRTVRVVRGLWLG